MIGIVGDRHATVIRLVTDSFMVRGTIETRHRRITDILNTAEHDFLVLTEATFVEFGLSGRAMQADYAQVNLNAVLFGVADEPVEPTPELRVKKVSERAYISVPPFTVTGQIHLLPGAALREALEDLVGRFIPVTDATYWSDRVGEAPTPALIVAVNHDRAQILAPHRDSDPWADIDRSGGAGAGPVAPEPASPWGDLPEPVVPQASSPLQRRLGQRSTGKSSLFPHSAQPPS